MTGVRIVVMVIAVTVVVFRIEGSAHYCVVVFGRPGVHVDVESSGRHLVANRVLNPHREGMGIFECRLRIAGDMHHSDQLAPNPADPHIVNFEDAIN
jgi:hypothetical protein